VARRLLIVLTGLIVVACGATPGKPGASAGPAEATAAPATQGGASLSSPAPGTTARPVPTNGHVRPTPVGNYGFQLVLLARENDWVLATSDDGAIVGSGPAGVPSASWEKVYSANAAGAGTHVSASFIESGHVERSWTVDGNWVIPTAGIARTPTGLSADERTLVLVEGSPSATESRFAILATQVTHAPRIISLPGQFAFDAISPNGATLYLIEYRADHADYVVRSVDTASGKLDEAIIVDKREPDELMAGVPIEQRQASGGKVYTLYQGPEHPFVHLLFTADRSAFCIDLPAAWGTDVAKTAGWGVALSGSEGQLFVANTALGVLGEINTNDLTVVRTTSFAPSARIQLAKFGGGKVGPAGGAMVLSPDRSTLYLADDAGVLAIDTGDFSVKNRLLTGTAVVSLGMAENGNVLYAVGRDGSAVLADPFSGDVIGRISGSGYTAVLRIVEPR
jgi:hypothetical protein